MKQAKIFCYSCTKVFKYNVLNVIMCVCACGSRGEGKTRETCVGKEKTRETCVGKEKRVKPSRIYSVKSTQFVEPTHFAWA